MNEEEIRNRIREIYKEQDDYFEKRDKVHQKYKEMEDAELSALCMSYDEWMNFERQTNKELCELKNELKKFNTPGKRKRNEYIDYLISKAKTDEKHKCPKHLHLDTDLPDTTKKAEELQERLVQTCIDYILEKDDRDIDRVDFSADALQMSANYGKWVPETDSFITTSSMVWNEKDGFPHLEETGRYC